MNEAIGAKGGHNDNLRRMRIKREHEKKEMTANELKELEKKVKRQQKFTLIKIAPIILTGGLIQTFSKANKDKEMVTVSILVDENTEDVEALEGNNNRIKEKKKSEIKVEIYQEELVKDNLKKVKKNDKIEEKEIEPEETLEKELENKSIKTTKEAISKRKVIGGLVEGVEQENENNLDTSVISDNELSASARDKFQKLKSRKIIEEYEKNLKDIRYDLRKLIFEYNILVEQEEDIILSKEAEVILDKLSDIIERIGVLKAKIKIEDLDKYDDNYIYTLIEGYLAEFKDKKVVKEIKDSPLYILIEDKLEELDKEKGKLDKKVKDKKEKLVEKEERFEILKDKVFNIDKVNDNLLKFQKEQEHLLQEVKEKVAKAVTIQEKVQIEFEAMNRQSKKLLNLLSLSLMFPGTRVARGMAISTATYLLFINNILRPRMVSKKYQVITVKDYSSDIENSIKSLDDASMLLGKTSKQIDKIMNQIKEEFADYLEVIPDASRLLSNLQKINSEIKEKEYEMERIKKEQELMLEKNNAKVRTKGTFPM